MQKRVFNIQKRLAQSLDGGIIDIPHLAILRYTDPNQIINDFTDAWGKKPEAVVIPVTAHDGLLFKVEGLSEAISQYATGISNKIKDFPDVIQTFAQMGLDIYLLIIPSLQFISADGLHIIDIVEDGSAQLCIGNPRAQEVIAAITGTAVDIVNTTTKNTPGKLKGVIFDTINLWPIGGKEERLELTCFCPSCENYIDSQKPGLIRQFKTFPNPWNLSLRTTDTGISNISEIRLRYSTTVVVPDLVRA